MNPTASPLPNSDDPVLELQHSRDQMQNQLAPLMQLNPIAQGVTGAGDQSVMPAEMSVQMERIKQVMNNPAVKSYMQLLNTPEFTEGAKALVNHPQKAYVAYGEIALFVILIFVKAWRSSRTKHWAAQLWVSFSTYAIGMVLGSVVIPGLVFGEPYWNLLKAVGRVFVPALF